MKHLLVLIACLLLTGSSVSGQSSQQQVLASQKITAAAGITVVQTVGSTGHLSSKTLSITATNGNWLILGFATDTTSTTITSVQDNNSNNFTQNVTKQPGSAGKKFYFYSLKAGAGVTSVIITFSQPEYFIAAVSEVSGLAASSPLDIADATGGQPSGATWTTGNVVTLNANDIVFGFAFNDAGATTITATTPWTVAYSVSDSTNGQAGCLVYQVVSSISTYAPTGTVAAYSLGVSYKGS